MSDMTKIEIELPAPPEGWGEVEYRHAVHGDCVLGATGWWPVSVISVYPHLTARKLPPLWTPPPELIACLKPGWLTRDSYDIVALHWMKPESNDSRWVSEGSEWRLNAINPNLLPPLTIPWDKCCFKIGEPKE